MPVSFDNIYILSSLTSPGRVLEPAQICDLLKGVIIILCCVLMEYVDVSMMYHLIRGQAIIKLYIFFNMLEVTFHTKYTSIKLVDKASYSKDVPIYSDNSW